MKRLLTILLTCISFYSFSQQYGQCLINQEHFHCSKNMQKQFFEIQQNIESLQSIVQQFQKAAKPPPSISDCWKTVKIPNSDPAFILNQNLSNYSYVKDSCGIVYLEYHLVMTNGFSQNRSQILFDLPTDIVPHHNTTDQADLLFDSKFETAIMRVDAVLKKLIFSRQDGNFYINPNKTEIKGRIFMRWQ